MASEAGRTRRQAPIPRRSGIERRGWSRNAACDTLSNMPGSEPTGSGGDLVSTPVTKPEGHAEGQDTSLILLQPKLVANDDNYALAA